MKTVEEAKKDLEDFLKKNPRMTEKQKEIDKILDNSSDRMEAVASMLGNSLMDLCDALAKLKDEVEGIPSVH